MTKTPNERLASIETKLEFLEDIKEYMEDATETRLDNAVKLSRIETSIVDFVDYQKTCDREREDQRKRLDAMENDIKLSKKIAGGIGAVVALVITSGVEYFKR